MKIFYIIWKLQTSTKQQSSTLQVRIFFGAKVPKPKLCFAFLPTHSYGQTMEQVEKNCIIESLPCARPSSNQLFMNTNIPILLIVHSNPPLVSSFLSF